MFAREHPGLWLATGEAEKGYLSTGYLVVVDGLA